MAKSLTHEVTVKVSLVTWLALATGAAGGFGFAACLVLADWLGLI